jgi:hypothetical protein
MQNKFDVWVTFRGEIGAVRFYCGALPEIGAHLNGSEVVLVTPQPNNANQFLVVLGR